jgi:hypothetical protein
MTRLSVTETRCSKTPDTVSGQKISKLADCPGTAR